MKLNSSDYVARIGSAGPVGLVVITFELILEHMAEAVSAFDDEKAYGRHVNLAIELLGTLIDALNMEYELSRTLFPLYIYVNKLLLSARITMNTDALEEVRRILTPVYEGWLELSRKDESPVIDKSQKIYAGLTYGRGELNEYIEIDNNKGYKA